LSAKIFASVTKRERGYGVGKGRVGAGGVEVLDAGIGCVSLIWHPPSNDRPPSAPPANEWPPLLETCRCLVGREVKICRARQRWKIKFLPNLPDPLFKQKITLVFSSYFPIAHLPYIGSWKKPIQE